MNKPFNSPLDPGLVSRNDIWITIRARDTSILRASPTMVKLLGLNGQDLTQCRLITCVQNGPSLRKHLNKKRLDKDASEKIIELRLKRSASTVLPMTCKMSFSQKDGDWTTIISRYSHAPHEPLLNGDMKLERWFQLALESAAYGYWDHCFHTGITANSERLYDILGYDPTSTVIDSEKWLSFIHPDDLDKSPELAIAADTSLRSRYNTEYRIRHRSGRWIWVEDSVLVFRDSTTWRPLKMIGMCRDVTETRSFERFVNELPIFYCSIDIGGHIIEVSNHWLEQFGYERDEVIGRKFTDFQTKESAKRTSAETLPLLWSTGALSNVLDTYVKKNGKLLHGLLSACTEQDANGDPIKSIVTLINFTGRKREQEALYRSERQFKEAFINAPHGMALVQLDGTFSETNQSLCKFLQCTPSDSLELDIQTVTHPDDLQTTLDGITSLKDDTQTVFNCEQRFVRSDGQPVWGLMSMAVVRGHSGKLIHFILQISDINSLKLVNAKATRLGRIIEASVNEVYTFDAGSLRFVAVNRGALKNLGYSEEELRGLTPVDIKPEYDRETFEEAIAPLRSGEIELLQFETVHRRKDGTDYDVQVNVALYEAEQPPVFIAIILDITERRQTELALHHVQKMEAIGQLTSGVAHDFNNLLTIIQGNLQLLARMSKKGEHDVELLDGALNASKRGADLISRLLVFSRKQSLHPISVDVRRLLENMRSVLERTIGAQIGIEIIVAPDVWSIKCDLAQVESAILNLAINARDAMPNGGALIIKAQNEQLVGPDASEPSGTRVDDYVRFSVSDNGGGMSEDETSKALQPYFTTKPHGSGTGLGLSMVHGFVNQSGGRLLLRSELGNGTTVVVDLPRCHDNPKLKTIANSQLDDVNLDNVKVLIVEDNEGVRRTTQRLLQNMGCKVIEANDGFMALRLLAKHKDIDILFSDIVMPGGVSGFELAHNASLDYPELKILLTSGHRLGLAPVTDNQKDNYPVLQKPFDQTQLLHEIQALLADS